MPQISTNFRIGESWKINSKFENRFILYQYPFEGTVRRAAYERSDLEFVVTRSIGPLKNLGAGYLVRRIDKDGSFLHRSIQQYSLSQEFTSLLLSHRFRTDQTFEKNEAVQFRLRYRISIEKPLNGLQVDPDEFYLKVNNEYLGILKSGKGNMEIRLLASVGYNLSESNQIEAGLDYRVENIIGRGKKNLLLITVGWYDSF
ncbi:MAG: DUF2490 domain-containing protein [Chitinophagaceae bacterium]